MDKDGAGGGRRQVSHGKSTPVFGLIWVGLGLPHMLLTGTRQQKPSDSWADKRVLHDGEEETLESTPPNRQL